MNKLPLLLGSLLAFSMNQSTAVTVFSDNGSTPSDIQGTVDAFRAALGTLNPNQPASFPDGRREINWDGVPDASSDPNAFPGNFFNGTTVGRARGIEFATPGTGFLLSSTAASGQPVGFGFPADFIPFSPQRMFAPAGSLITDVNFFLPGTTTPGAVMGLGIVFNDVETADLTTLELFDANGSLLASDTVAAGPNGGLSFLGIIVDGPWVASARVSTGDSVLISNGVFSSGQDGVVMDDFIYGEPQSLATPDGGSTFLIFSFGLLAAAGIRRRQNAS